MVYTFQALAISGLPGSGKSALIDSLEPDIPDWLKEGVGDGLRRKHECIKPVDVYGKPMEFAKWYPTVSDRDIIKINEELAERVRTGRVKIADSRFVHYLDSRTVLKILSLLIWV